MISWEYFAEDDDWDMLSCASFWTEINTYVFLIKKHTHPSLGYAEFALEISQKCPNTESIKQQGFFIFLHIEQDSPSCRLNKGSSSSCKFYKGSLSTCRFLITVPDLGLELHLKMWPYMMIVVLEIVCLWFFFSRPVLCRGDWSVLQLLW